MAQTIPSEVSREDRIAKSKAHVRMRMRQRTNLDYTEDLHDTIVAILRDNSTPRHKQVRWIRRSDGRKSEWCVRWQEPDGSIHFLPVVYNASLRCLSTVLPRSALHEWALLSRIPDAWVAEIGEQERASKAKVTIGDVDDKVLLSVAPDETTEQQRTPELDAVPDARPKMVRLADLYPQCGQHRKAVLEWVKTNFSDGRAELRRRPNRSDTEMWVTQDVADAVLARYGRKKDSMVAMPAPQGDMVRLADIYPQITKSCEAVCNWVRRNFPNGIEVRMGSGGKCRELWVPREVMNAALARYGQPQTNGVAKRDPNRDDWVRASSLYPRLRYSSTNSATYIAKKVADDQKEKRPAQRCSQGVWFLSPQAAEQMLRDIGKPTAFAVDPGHDEGTTIVQATVVRIDATHDASTPTGRRMLTEAERQAVHQCAADLGLDAERFAWTQLGKPVALLSIPECDLLRETMQEEYTRLAERQQQRQADEDEAWAMHADLERQARELAEAEAREFAERQRILSIVQPLLDELRELLDKAVQASRDNDRLQRQIDAKLEHQLDALVARTGGLEARMTGFAMHWDDLEARVLASGEAAVEAGRDAREAKALATPKRRWWKLGRE